MLQGNNKLDELCDIFPTLPVRDEEYASRLRSLNESALNYQELPSLWWEIRTDFQIRDGLEKLGNSLSEDLFEQSNNRRFERSETGGILVKNNRTDARVSEFDGLYRFFSGEVLVSEVKVGRSNSNEKKKPVDILYKRLKPLFDRVGAKKVGYVLVQANHHFGDEESAVHAKLKRAGVRIISLGNLRGNLRTIAEDALKTHVPDYYDKYITAHERSFGLSRRGNITPCEKRKNFKPKYNSSDRGKSYRFRS